MTRYSGSRRSWFSTLLGGEPVEPVAFAQRRLDERGRTAHDWTVTFSIGGYRDINMQVPGVDDETGEVLSEQDVIQMVIALFDERDPELGTNEWRSLDVRIDGRTTLLTFRGSWVACFTLNRNRRGGWE